MRIELTLEPEAEEDIAGFCDADGRFLICQEWADDNGLDGAKHIAVTVSAEDNDGLKVLKVQCSHDPRRVNCLVGSDKTPTDLSWDAYEALEAYCRENNTDTFWVQFEVLS